MKIKRWLIAYKHPLFALCNKAFFNTVHIANGGYGVIWNDDLDLSEFELWMKGVEVSNVSELVAKVA